MGNFMSSIVSFVKFTQKKVDGTMLGAVSFYGTGYDPSIGHIPSVLGEHANEIAENAKNDFLNGIEPYCRQMDAIRQLAVPQPAYPQFELFHDSFYMRTFCTIDPCQKTFTFNSQLLHKQLDELEKELSNDQDPNRELTKRAIEEAIEKTKKAIKYFPLLQKYLEEFGYQLV